eukprot:NP_001254979.1 Fatty-acid and retinol-binding protein 1 [Caenorhabditis elegans]
MRLRLSSRRLSLKDVRSTLNTWPERSHPSTPSRPPPRHEKVQAMVGQYLN